MHYSPVITWGKGFTNKFDLQHCKRVLDIGCRKGQLSAYLAEHYQQQHFTAIDNIQEEIDQAKQYHLSNLNFAIADALLLAFSDYFDAVVSFSCLHWIKNKDKVLQNIYRALKPGGKTYLQFFVSHGRPKNDRFLYKIANSSRWKQYFKGFSPDYSEITLREFSALLQNTGFIIHKFEFVKYETIFENSEQLHRWFESWASHQKRVPQRKQQHFLQEVVLSYLDQHHYLSHESFPYYEYSLEVICEKSLTPLSADSPVYQYGPIVFTPREIDVLKHFLQGKSAKEIALLNSISSKAIEFHLANIKEKLNCHRRSEIYQAAISYGFIHLMFDQHFKSK